MLEDVDVLVIRGNMFRSGVTGRAAIHKKSTELSSECCGAQRPPAAAAAAAAAADDADPDPDPPQGSAFLNGAHLSSCISAFSTISPLFSCHISV